MDRELRFCSNTRQNGRYSQTMFLNSPSCMNSAVCLNQIKMYFGKFRSMSYLTIWSLDTMDAMLQAILSNAYCW